MDLLGPVQYFSVQINFVSQLCIPNKFDSPFNILKVNFYRKRLQTKIFNALYVFFSIVWSVSCHACYDAMTYRIVSMSIHRRWRNSTRVIVYHSVRSYDSQRHFERQLTAHDVNELAIHWYSVHENGLVRVGLRAYRDAAFGFAMEAWGVEFFLKFSWL